MSGAIQPQLVNGDIVLRVIGLVLTYPLYALLGRPPDACSRATNRWPW